MRIEVVQDRCLPPVVGREERAEVQPQVFGLTPQSPQPARRRGAIAGCVANLLEAETHPVQLLQLWDLLEQALQRLPFLRCQALWITAVGPHRLTEGIQWNVLAVNTHRPLFWFLGRGEVKSMDDLRGRRLAIHPPRTAPGCFARIVLRRHGLDPDRDLQCVVRAPGDYQMDLLRLRDGSIDAAYVGSTLAPEQVAGEEGFSVLSWVGDHFQIPTVGIAVDPTRIPLDNPALQALVRANQLALLTIAEQPQLAVDYIASFLGRLTRDEVQRYYERYIGPYFTSDGRVDLNVAQHAIDAVATELGVAAASVDQMYQPAL